MKYFLLRIPCILIILSLLLYSNKAYTKDQIKILDQTFHKCSATFNRMEQECPEFSSMRCFNHLMKANLDTQLCYKNIAVQLFQKYYGLSLKESEKRFDEYHQFVYNQYLFIFSETTFCKKENCGISIDLYTQYTTTREMYNYIDKIIGSISARI